MAKGGRNLGAAIAVGVPLVVLVVLTLMFWNPGLIILLVLFTSLGVVEVHDALRRMGLNACVPPIIICNVLTIGGAYVAALFQNSTHIPWHVVLMGCLGLSVMLSLVWRMFYGTEDFAKDAAASLFIVAYVSLLASFIGLILAMDDGALKLTVVFLGVVASDTGGYALGATLGKHQLAPVISPKKTWEGVLGSFLLSAATMVVMCVFFTGWAWWYGFVIAAVCVVFGTAGDLVESMIKRDAGLKDMSSILPGHGGVMDRLDSILFAAPAGWFLLSLPIPLA
ncbi:MAG: phosphatidate cytidylyltransferase [Propionibacteriaceae bacterium]|jgi:phosphatidate cytidylyltransferase|nr:phosphatidate cytidylyltransferase [Propionibacteriaceae bacterium]